MNHPDHLDAASDEYHRAIATAAEAWKIAEADIAQNIYGETYAAACAADLACVAARDALLAAYAN